MPKKLSRPRFHVPKFVSALRKLHADQRGTIAVMMGILLPVMVGMLGIGFEIGNWYLRTRAMQNAADAAAIAAATNASAASTSPTYQAEADSVAANYNFVNGSNNVTVTSDASNSYCPTGITFVPPSNDLCYKVTITGLVPLYLSEVVGFTGDATVNGARAKTLRSTAIAYAPDLNQPVCLLGLDRTGTAVGTNGSPNANFTGCTVMSNSDATCNGSNLLAWMGIAVGTNGGGAGCGGIQLSDQQPMADPFSQYAVNIPNNLHCNNNWPQESGSKKGSFTGWTQAPPITNNQITVCGDLQLQSDITINASTPTVLYIENGMLDMNNHTLTTKNVTIVFTGNNNDPGAPTYSHYPTDAPGNQSLLAVCIAVHHGDIDLDHSPFCIFCAAAKELCS